MTLSITKVSITTLSIICLFTTLSIIEILHKWQSAQQRSTITLSVVILGVVPLIYCYAEYHYAECRYAECHYAECRGAL